VIASAGIGSTFSSIHGALHSTAFAIAGDVLVLLAGVLWLGLGFRVHRDARRRIEDGRLVAIATALGFLVPYAGPLVYLLFRPPETLADARAREAEMRALRIRLARPEEVCPVCRTEVESDYLICPVCTTRLREPCPRCSSPLDPLWQACPYCATDRGAAYADLDTALTAEMAINAELERQRAQRLS
jgi:hypothetical protein